MSTGSPVNIFELINNESRLALKFFLTEGGKRFYDGLKQGELLLPYCPRCELYAYPPRLLCLRCETPLEPGSSLKGLFRLRGFTQQHRALRFVRPDVIGIVEHSRVIGRIFGRIDEPLETLRLGEELEFFPFVIEGDLVVPGFRKPRP